jgi:hypothetical protein
MQNQIALVCISRQTHIGNRLFVIGFYDGSRVIIQCVGFAIQVLQFKTESAQRILE